MMQLIIFVGLQASGKTTFFCTYFAATHEHISKDLLRNNKNKDRRQTQLIESALKSERSVVVDNTNPTIEVRASLIELGCKYGCEIIGYYFESQVNHCLQRNTQRTGKARVPEVGIYATFKKLTPPSYAEGFHQLFYVQIADLEHGDKKMGQASYPDPDTQVEKTQNKPAPFFQAMPPTDGFEVCAWTKNEVVDG